MELSIKCYSLANWLNPTIWDRFLERLDAVGGCRLIKLDERDPVRRKVESWKGQADYLVNFGEKETYKMVFGIFADKIGDCSLTIHRNPVEWWNNLALSVNVEKLATCRQVDPIAIFQLCLEGLDPFWAHIDSPDAMKSYRASPGGGTVSFNRELPPIMWKTFLGDVYLDYFKQRLGESMVECESICGGGIVTLAPLINEVTTELRVNMVEKLGRECFAPFKTTPEDRLIHKAVGQYVPTTKDIYLRQCKLRGEKPLFLEHSA